jgi:hypothetical protein
MMLESISLQNIELLRTKIYPVLYLSHGGGGTDSDWFNQGRAHNTLDRFIASGELEPTVVVTPNFHNLGFTQAQYATNTTIEGFDVGMTTSST